MLPMSAPDMTLESEAESMLDDTESDVITSRRYGGHHGDTDPIVAGGPHPGGAGGQGVRWTVKHRKALVVVGALGAAALVAAIIIGVYFIVVSFRS